MGDNEAPGRQTSTAGVLGVGLVLLMLGGVVALAFAGTSLQGVGYFFVIVGGILLVIWVVLLVRARSS